MSKYKVGDLVRVKKDLECGSGYDSGCLFRREMGKYKGTCHKITNINNKGCYEDQRYTLEDCEEWSFSNSMLELVYISIGDELVFSKLKQLESNLYAGEWSIECDGCTKEEMKKKGYFWIESCAVKRKDWIPYTEQSKEIVDYCKQDIIITSGLKNIEKEEKDMEKVLEIYKKRALEMLNEEEEKEIEKVIGENVVISKFKKIEQTYIDSMRALIEEYDVDSEFILEDECDCRFVIDDSYISEITEPTKTKYDKKKKEVNDLLEEVQARIDLVKETSNDYKEIEKILTDYEIFENTKSPFTKQKAVKKNKKD